MSYYRHLFRFYEFIQPYVRASLPVEERFKGKRILSLSPHIDDDVIGSGGTFYKHFLEGEKITSLYLCGDEKRKKEGEEAARIIGIKSRIYLGYPERSLKKNLEAEERVKEVISEVSPEVVVLPFLLDNHPDHREVNRILVNLLKKQGQNFLIYGYGVWLPVYPNLLVDISGVVEVKKQAIEKYKSQIKSRNYLEQALSINRFWAIVKGRKIKYAEPFFRATPKGYIELWKRIYENK